MDAVFYSSVRPTYRLSLLAFTVLSTIPPID